VSTFIEKGLKISDTKEIATKFNDFFTNIGSNLAKSIPHSVRDIYSYLKGPPCNSFTFFPTDADEIVKVTSSLQNKCSAGYDEIPVHLMKLSIQYVAEPISKILNSSLLMGIFPDTLKIAKVCPVFKDGEPNHFTNYRPISVLPSFSKIFEKVISNRLLCYLEKNRILSTNQYGFRKKPFYFYGNC